MRFTLLCWAALLSCSIGSFVPAPRPWVNPPGWASSVTEQRSPGLFGGYGRGISDDRVRTTALWAGVSSTSTCRDIRIRQAGLRDCWRLADFVLKGEPEYCTVEARHRLDARLKYHIMNGVSIHMATRRVGLVEQLVGIYACSTIDYIPIPPLPRNNFPAVCNVLPRRFLSDVKVAEPYRRLGVATMMLQHFEEEEESSSPAGAVGCLFVLRSNIAAIRLYEKAGYKAVYADFSRMQYRSLLAAGAVAPGEINQMIFMVKHLGKPKTVVEPGASSGPLLGLAM